MATPKGKKNLHPKIEQLVQISQYTVGDNPSVKYKGFHISPAQAKLLAHWHEAKIEVKLTLQQNEGELYDDADNNKNDADNKDDPKLIEEMSPKKKTDKDDKKE